MYSSQHWCIPLLISIQMSMRRRPEMLSRKVTSWMDGRNGLAGRDRTAGAGAGGRREISCLNGQKSPFQFPILVHVDVAPQCPELNCSDMRAQYAWARPSTDRDRAYRLKTCSPLCISDPIGLRIPLLASLRAPSVMDNDSFPDGPAEMLPPRYLGGGFLSRTAIAHCQKQVG
ncbi:hypothetical protein BOTBODRAFT_44882 [Botryobasidium botryosum FD-172 SS1]|uniref:Uncharacterized protein n=1 Tax=Botryobasidium botryosum (strain FD-172 SS1) TaxID=930990 RepID=A0A067MGX7_BOTB1|nr:hypothetical protein BOTBODRAFT_44882 [Botryobasidium botryosum FD-172 SS1]